MTKTAGIRELKAHLSRFLRDVERGDTILVSDRGRVIAEVRRPGAPEQDSDPVSLRRAQLVARGILRPASEPEAREWSAFRGLRAKRGSARAVLDAERGD